MKTRTEIEKKLKKFFDAFISKNWQIFSDCIDESFKYYTDNCVVQNKNEFVEFLIKDPWKGSGYTVSDLNIIISDNNDMVICHYIIEFKSSDAESNFSVNAIETMALLKKNDEWKIIHYHTSN